MNSEAVRSKSAVDALVTMLRVMHPDMAALECERRALAWLVAHPDPRALLGWALRVTRADDSESLAVDDPDEYERRLRSYFLLLGCGPCDVRDACLRAESGDVPPRELLNDPAVVAEIPRACQDIHGERARQARYDKVAAIHLAAERARRGALREAA